jgi:hypothetical protein
MAMSQRVVEQQERTLTGARGENEGKEDKCSQGPRSLGWVVL